MANISLTTLATSDKNISIVESFQQMDLPAEEAVVAGAPVRIDATNGTFRNGNATTATEADIYGLAFNGTQANLPVTAIRSGVVDGFDLSGLDYWDSVYLSDTDARIADAAGTVTRRIGMVIPGTAVPKGTAYDKLLLVDIARAEVPASDDFAVANADGLTVNSVIVPVTLYASFSLNPMATITEFDLMIAKRALQVVSIDVVPSTLQGGALTATIVKATGTATPANGTTPMHTANAINLNTGAYTVQSISLTATAADLVLAAGDRIGVDYSAALTAGKAAVTIGYQYV